MPKNKGKGGKNRRRGKNENEPMKRELQYRTVDQAYAQVLRMLGNGRFQAKCLHDGVTRMCHIRGKLRKKVWINAGDIVLVSLRTYQDEKADVLGRYLPDEAKRLQKEGEIPSHVDLSSLIEGPANNVDTMNDVTFGVAGEDYDSSGDEDKPARQPYLDLPSSGSESDDVDEDDVDFI